MTMASERIFSDLKVLDVSTFIAAPAAAAVLSDFGADVIKIEGPGTGDTQRRLSSLPPSPRAQGNYAGHQANRNKRGTCIDLKSPFGTTILRRLVEWADVVITNFPHGVREKLHLGYDEVSAWNPRVIYADVTGYGDAGPDAKLPGFDLTAYWARSGLLESTRDAGAPPTAPVPGSGDYGTAIGLYAAIVTALYERERTGKGMSVGTSLLAAGVWATATFVGGALAGGEPYGLHDRTRPTNPLMNPYQSSDGHWFMLVAPPAHGPGLAKAIGHPELLDDPRFADAQSIVENSAALTALLDATFRSQPLAHWKEVFDQARITYGVIQTPQAVVEDPQLRANDIVVPLHGDDEVELTISSPINLRGTAKVPATRGPALGEHNDEVLLELGFTHDEIDEFRSKGVIPGGKQLEAA
jgi:crotonobetainyl-CoA:carnitine CoA-transferase CaiB-like acyl-CoA transferase